MKRRMRLQNYQRTFLRVNFPSLSLPLPSSLLLPFLLFPPLLVLFSFPSLFSPFLVLFFSFHAGRYRRGDESFVTNENATILRCTPRYDISRVKGSEGTITFDENIGVQCVTAFYRESKKKRNAYCVQGSSRSVIVGKIS